MGMPQVDGAFSSWLDSFEVARQRQKVAVDGRVWARWEPQKFRGCFQPFRPENVEYSGDGQRSWEWLKLFAKDTEVELECGDRVRWKSLPFKVMRKSDWSRNGYRQYELVEVCHAEGGE
jgi:hypothetical protein